MVNARVVKDAQDNVLLHVLEGVILPAILAQGLVEKPVEELVVQHVKVGVVQLVKLLVLQTVQQHVETTVAELLLHNMIGRSYLITTSFFLL